MTEQASERWAVALSGGVDSSVAAALLRRAGLEVVGFTLRLGSAGWEATRACCGLTELHDARRVADALEIPHYVLNLADVFEREVIDDFVAEYLAGRTPNPCLRCNQHIKFATFLEQARALGCVGVATGHYARVERDGLTGRWQLRRGRDADKDQSYVLSPLTQAQLAAVRFPLGELTKPEVRRLAGELGLVTAAKAESQEICFVADGHYAEFVRQRAPERVRPGAIVDGAGRPVGEHEGIVGYTVGQRRRLGVNSPEPLFVSEIRAAENLIVVEPDAAARRSVCWLTDLNWVSLAPTAEVVGLVQLRSRMTPVAGRLTSAPEPRLELTEGLRGISPGQAAVVYDGAGRVLVAGTIDRIEPPAKE